MKQSYAPFVAFAGSFLVLAIFLRLIYEILAPVVVPLAVIAVVVLAVYVVLGRR